MSFERHFFRSPPNLTCRGFPQKGRLKYFGMVSRLRKRFFCRNISFRVSPVAKLTFHNFQKNPEKALYEKFLSALFYLWQFLFLSFARSLGTGLSPFHPSRIRPRGDLNASSFFPSFATTYFPHLFFCVSQKICVRCYLRRGFFYW